MFTLLFILYVYISYIVYFASDKNFTTTTTTTTTTTAAATTTTTTSSTQGLIPFFVCRKRKQFVSFSCVSINSFLFLWYVFCAEDFLNHLIFIMCS